VDIHGPLAASLHRHLANLFNRVEQLLITLLAQYLAEDFTKHAHVFAQRRMAIGCHARRAVGCCSLVAVCCHSPSDSCFAPVAIKGTMAAPLKNSRKASGFP